MMYHITFSWQKNATNLDLLSQNLSQKKLKKKEEEVLFIYTGPLEQPSCHTSQQKATKYLDYNARRNVLRFTASSHK